MEINSIPKFNDKGTILQLKEIIMNTQVILTSNFLKSRKHEDKDETSTEKEMDQNKIEHTKQSRKAES